MAAGLSDKCTIQIGGAIGVSKPLSFYVDLHDTGKGRSGEAGKILPELVGGALSPRRSASI